MVPGTPRWVWLSFHHWHITARRAMGRLLKPPAGQLARHASHTQASCPLFIPAGQALTGSDAQRFSLLAAKVAEEQQQFFQVRWYDFFC